MLGPLRLLRSAAIPAALLLGAVLLAGCGSSTGSASGGGGASDGGGTSTAGGAGATTSESTKSDTKVPSKGTWPPPDACALISEDSITEKLGESLSGTPRARAGAYGPSCEYDSEVASPNAVVQAFPVEDLKDYTESLQQRGAVVKVPGVGDSAFLQMSNPAIADASLYVLAGSKAFSVQVAVYGGDGTWTGDRAKAATVAIAKAIIG